MGAEKLHHAVGHDRVIQRSGRLTALDGLHTNRQLVLDQSFRWLSSTFPAPKPPPKSGGLPVLTQALPRIAMLPPVPEFEHRLVKDM